MKKVILIFLVTMLLAGALAAQETYYSFFSYSYFIPRVSINDRSVSLQAGVTPDLYRDRSVARDMRWVAENDSLIVAFWQEKGDTVLHILRELSGIAWQETDFDIYLVRYYPSIGSGDPLVIPIGGITRGTLIEAAPEDNRQLFNLVYQLAHRMLAQTVQPEESVRLGIAEHPMMRPSPYRLDNLAMALALSTCQNVLGIDSTNDAYQSAFWKRHQPGRTIFEQYILNQWVLTPDQTLADWVASEPWSSRLVTVTRPPRKPRQQAIGPRLFVEGLPLKGIFGFSATMNDANRLTVEKIDVYRLAYACGLREGDGIRRVNDRLVRSHRELIEKVLETFDEGGATLEIVRDGQYMKVIIQPILLPSWEDDVYFDDYPEEFDVQDTLLEDSLEPY